jgi:hypothetical protein
MSKLNNYATTVNPGTDVVCAYACGPYTPAPVTPNAPWVVIGSFTVPLAIACRLLVIGLAQGAAVLSVALYGPGLVPGSLVVVVDADSDTEHRSNAVALEPGVVYNVAAQFLGATGTGSIRTVSLGAL